MTALCAICAQNEAQPVICGRCEDRARTDLDNVGRMRKALHDWSEIDTGTPGKDEAHVLAVLDNPVLTSRGGPDLTVIAATDARSRRIIAGWHDRDCTDKTCPDQAECTDPAHREDAADDVVNVDAELAAEAHHINSARRLSTPLADVFDALRVINISFDWSVRSERAGDFSAIIGACAAALRSILHDTSDRVVGECTATHPERDMCGGPLRFAWIGPLSIDPQNQVRPTHVQCSWCRDLWPCDAATLVGMLRVAGSAPIPVPRAWAADVCGVRVKTVHEWVRRGHVTAYPGDLVNLVDVLARVDTPTAVTGREGIA